MKCSHYEGNRRCGFKSEYWVLAQKDVKDYCESNYKACDIFIQHAIKHLKKAKSGI